MYILKLLGLEINHIERIKIMQSFTNVIYLYLVVQAKVMYKDVTALKMPVGISREFAITVCEYQL